MKIFLQDHNNILADVAEHVKLVDNITDADKVVIWQDIVGLGRGIATLAKQQRKPVIVAQHGISSWIDYGPPNRYSFVADKMCVWGPESKEKLVELGISEKKVVVTGSTIFSHLKPKEKHEGVNIVFRPAHWSALALQENTEVSEVLRGVAKEHGFKITTKAVETQDPKGWENVVQTHRDRPGHLEACADVLKTADLVVAVAGDGTFEMMAYMLNIPVLIPDVWVPKQFLEKPTPDIIYSDACGLIPFKDLEDEILLTLDDPDEHKEARMKVAREVGGMGIENPLENILKVINDA